MRRRENHIDKNRKMESASCWRAWRTKLLADELKRRQAAEQRAAQVRAAQKRAKQIQTLKRYLLNEELKKILGELEIKERVRVFIEFKMSDCESSIKCLEQGKEIMLLERYKSKKSEDTSDFVKTGVPPTQTTEQEAQEPMERIWKTIASIIYERKKLQDDQGLLKKEIPIEEEVIQFIEKKKGVAKEKLHATQESYRKVEAQMNVLSERAKNIEQELDLMNPNPKPPHHPMYENGKMDAVLSTLAAMTVTRFREKPLTLLPPLLIITFLGKTLLGAITGGVLLGVCFGPPLLGLIIWGLIALKQRMSRPPRCPRHSFFNADDAYKVDIAARAPSLMNEEEKSRRDSSSDTTACSDGKNDTPELNVSLIFN